MEQGSLFIYDKDNITKLIESSLDRYIRIWNFHSGKLLNKIKAGIQIVRGGDIRNHFLEILCGVNLWDDNYLIAACNNGIKFIDLKNGIIFKKIDENNVITIQKLKHPKFGECLISQGNENSKIKLWIIKNVF